MKKKVIIGIMIVLAAVALIFAYQSYHYYKMYHDMLVAKENARIEKNISHDIQKESAESDAGKEVTAQEPDEHLTADVKEVAANFIDIFIENSRNPYERYIALKEYMTEDAIRDFYKLDESKMSPEELEKMLQETSRAEEIEDTVINSEILTMRAVVEMGKNKTSAAVMINGKKHIYNDKIELDNVTDFLFDADMIFKDNHWVIEKIYEIK